MTNVLAAATFAFFVALAVAAGVTGRRATVSALIILILAVARKNFTFPVRDLGHQRSAVGAQP